jgi:fructosamine-3-kinase
MIELRKIKKQIEEKLSSKIQSSSKINEGVMNFVFDVEVDSSEYILKVNPLDRKDIAIKESNAIMISHSEGCRVPNVILAKKSSSNIDSSFLFYKKIQGGSLNLKFDTLCKTDVLKITTQIADDFKIMSSIKLDGFGETFDFNKFSNKTWKDFLRIESKEAIDYVSGKKLFNCEQISKLENYIDKEIENIGVIHSSFVWTDFDPSNIIIDKNNNFAGFIDFEGVIGGDPEYALGCLIAKFGFDNFTEQLIKQLNYPKDRLEFYAVIRYLRLIKYSDHPLPTGIERNDINYFLPYANKVISSIVMKTDSKGNSFGYKLIAAIIITFLFTGCFYGFLFYFNELYEINPSGMRITINEGLSDNIDINSFFLLFGFLASLGSLVRVIYDFIGHTCYTKVFDFKEWWPWYFFRPLIGFILGAVFVIFFDQSLFGNNGKDLSKFPFLLAFITGFAVTDAISFLKEISKRIFGGQVTKKKDQS